MSRVRKPIGKFVKRGQSTSFLSIAGMIGCLVVGIFIGRATKKTDDTQDEKADRTAVTVNNAKTGSTAKPADTKKRPPVRAPRKVWKVSVADHNPYKGPKDALVTIVEWSDYQ